MCVCLEIWRPSLYNFYLHDHAYAEGRSTFAVGPVGARRPTRIDMHRIVRFHLIGTSVVCTVSKPKKERKCIDGKKNNAHQKQKKKTPLLQSERFPSVPSPLSPLKEERRKIMRVEFVFAFSFMKAPCLHPRTRRPSSRRNLVVGERSLRPGYPVRPPQTYQPFPDQAQR